MNEIKLILGDCIEEMKKIPDKSIDLIFADYPFNCQDGRKDYIDFINLTVNEVNRISKDISNLVVINTPHSIFKTSHFYHDWTLINGIALIRKGALRPAWHFGFQHNYCLILNKGNVKNKWNGTKINHDKTFPTDVIEYQNGYRGKGKDCFHPQAIPLDLTKKFVAYLSNKDDTILDTFLGSGTTGVACKELSRNFIGIEINEKYYRMAKNRIENTIIGIF